MQSAEDRLSLVMMNKQYATDQRSLLSRIHSFRRFWSAYLVFRQRKLPTRIEIDRTAIELKMELTSSSREFTIVAAAFLINAFTIGQIKALGPFFLQFQIDLNANAGQSSLPLSLLYGANFAIGPFASMIANRFGFRITIVMGGLLSGFGAILCTFANSVNILYITFIMIGAGSGFCSVPCFAILGLRFKEKRPLANNIMTMGSALLSIPLSPLVQLWIYEYTWQGTILILGGLFFNTIPNGLLITRDVITSGEKKEWRISDMKMLTNFSFVIFLITCGCDVVAMMCVNIYLVRFSQSKGTNDYLSASLSSLGSIVDLCLRPFSGYFISRAYIGNIRIVRSYVFAGIALLQACVVSMFTLCKDIYAIAVTTILYSVCIGCRGALAITLLSEFFGTDRLVTALGLRSLSLGVFSATIPPLVGKMIDARGSFNMAFYASTVLSILSATGVVITKITSSNGESSNTQHIQKSILANDEAIKKTTET